MNGDTKSLVLSIIIVIIMLFLIVFSSAFFIDPPEQIDENNNIQYKIGLVKPVFTQTAYYPGNYYDFFHCDIANDCEYEASHYLESELLTDMNAEYLNWFYDLNTSDYRSTWGESIRELKSMQPQIDIITDLTVHNGDIEQYDLLIFFHNEYVTIEEYHNTINFIKKGGNVMILNGNAFFAEVKYHEETNILQLVNGHRVKYFEQNDSYVHQSRYYYRFYNSSDIENSYAYKYIGSRYTTFYSVAYYPEMITQIGNSNLTNNIVSIEENTVINPNVETIINWKHVDNSEQKDLGVQTYQYYPFSNVGGRIIHMGLYSTYMLVHDINYDYQNFLLQLIIYQLKT